ncbi:MAG: putative toxin-antitoxin system toxin component, PIN family [Acidobacteriaceae bacterium]|nr:putative toxin-antitoxin system toxin component, PIN family [Acidobacteriaceae bacterium]MBV9767045.1 putative toxin-antitoxin system toxin component, PIN family [Acidobacteriaceae bacterium]
MRRVTAESNIIVSGLNFPGNARQLLASAEAGAIRLCVSPAILEEVAEVLQREKFGWSAAEAQEAIDWISQIADVVEPKQTVDVIKSDPDDNRILECALAACADYIISGDKHLLNVTTFYGTPILRAAEFIQLTQGQGD